jgi:hypothetical protein
VSLGTVLPEERLSAAARWTGRALLVAERLQDPVFLAHALRMHGNELRKAGRLTAAAQRLVRAIHLSQDLEGQGAAYALLARAAGELGDPDLFHYAITGYGRLVDASLGRGMLFNPFTFREIQLRGLINIGRSVEAIRLMDMGMVDAAPVAPQWHIIERVTAGEVFLAAGEQDAAQEAIHLAVTSAEAHRLPHQIQRAVRAATSGGLPEVADAGHSALARLNELLAPTVHS